MWTFSHNNPSHEGEIPDRALTFPKGFAKNRNWKSFTVKTEEGSYNYAYGDLKATEVSYVKDFFSHSVLVGINRNGKIQPLGLSLPNSIPNNSIISVLLIKGK